MKFLNSIFYKIQVLIQFIDSCLQIEYFIFYCIFDVFQPMDTSIDFVENEYSLWFV